MSIKFNTLFSTQRQDNANGAPVLLSDGTIYLLDFVWTGDLEAQYTVTGNELAAITVASTQWGAVTGGVTAWTSLACTADTFTGTKTARSFFITAGGTQYNIGASLTAGYLNATGTVGLSGSGADMILSKVNLTSGTAFNITNFTLRF